MSYIKQTWVDGDIVTAEKMNHIEDGVANSDTKGNSTYYVFYYSDDGEGSTYFRGNIQEAFEALSKGIYPILVFDNGYGTREIAHLIYYYQNEYMQFARVPMGPISSTGVNYTIEYYRVTANGLENKGITQLTINHDE